MMSSSSSGNMMTKRASTIIPPEEEGKQGEQEALSIPAKDNNNAGGVSTSASPQQQQQHSTAAGAGGGSPSRVATVSSPWQYDDVQNQCTGCGCQFHALNRRHHCRLCGKIFCGKCSDQRALIPPSSIVLVPIGGKKVKPAAASGGGHSTFSPEEDPDRMLTYLRGGGGDDSQHQHDAADRHVQELIYGRGLEERFTLAREPLRVCRPCWDQLQPLQEDLRNSNSNAVRFNHVDPVDPRRLFNSPLAFTLGHEIRKAAYTLNNLLPLPKRRLGAMMVHQQQPTTQSYETSSAAANDPYGFYHDPASTTGGMDNNMQQCKETCSAVSPNLGDLDGVRIPARLLEEARGIAVMTVMKTGFGLAGVEFGTGLAVARLSSDSNNNAPPNNTAGGWSAPCAIGTAGVSWGALIGAQVSDHVFLLMTDDAVRLLFDNKGSLQLGADVGVAVGPLGRTLEGNVGAAYGAKMAPILSYSLSKGLYAGISLDGKVIVTRERVNEKFYGRAVTAREILQGNAVPIPPAAQPLYEALTRCRVYATNSNSNNHHKSGSGATTRTTTATYYSAGHHHQYYSDALHQRMIQAPTTGGNTAQYHYPSVLPQQQQQQQGAAGGTGIPPATPTVMIQPTIQEDASLQQQQLQLQQQQLQQQQHPLQMPPLQPDQHSYYAAGDNVSALTSEFSGL